MKLCYEGLKEIGVDVNEIRRKMLGFKASNRVVTPYFDRPCEMKLCYEGFERNWS